MDNMDQVQQYVQNMQQALETERIKTSQMHNEMNKDSVFPQADTKNIIEYQLDSSRLLDKAFHLLSGHVIQKGGDGSDIWVDPTDDRLKIFSKYGVERIMNLLSTYITPEVILSIFDLDTINREVKDFGIELTDLIANRYELFFHYPTPEDLFEKVKPIIREKDLIISDEDIYLKCIDWSNDELSMKLANYPIVVQSLVALVHANYRRAYNGETLKSLRTITHISQSLNGEGGAQMFKSPEQNKTRLLKPSTWGSN